MFHKSCHLSRWNSLFGSFNENRIGAQLSVTHYQQISLQFFVAPV